MARVALKNTDRRKPKPKTKGVDWSKLPKEKRYKVVDKIGWDTMNHYMDHLDKCPTCREVLYRI